jgi:phospholipase C
MKREFSWLALALALAGCTTRPTAQAVAAKMDACGYVPGLKASDTLPATMPTGADIPIEHIILLMQENRSFDHYYSMLDIPGLDVASPTATNLDSMGNTVPRFHFTTKCMAGGHHDWTDQHAYLDGGKLDGFVMHNEDSSVPMGYYTADDLPFYYALAKTFAIGDRHFCSVLGPTWPNREYYFSATSHGKTDNSFPPLNDPSGKPYQNLFRELDTAKVSWNVYAQDEPTPIIVASDLWGGVDNGNFLNTANFASDVAAGKLASVTLVEASDLKGVNSPDEGPPGDVDIGQQFTSMVIDTIMHSPFWKNSIIFLTYDENGGMYDHVVPPKACAPDDIKPLDSSVPGADFTQYGFRVPLFVISPYAKRGYVSHQVGDHTSILRFVEARFDLPAMTIRDANALPPYDMLDFEHPDFSVPALPTVTVDQTALAACNGN